MARWRSRAVDGIIVCSLVFCCIFAARPRRNSQRAMAVQTLALAALAALLARSLSRRRPSRTASAHSSGTLVSIVAHEIRAPLAAIRGAVGLLEEHEPELEPERKRELLAVALDAAKQLGYLVDDLLLISRITGGRLTVERVPIDLVAIVRDAARAQIAHPIIVVEQERLPYVVGDPMRVRQVVTNLLSNAIANAKHDSVVLASIARHEDGVRVTVYNDGRGIPPEEQSRLFLPFASLTERRVDSTGLGLYIAKELVDAMGGTIGFDTQPGRNAAFWFTLAATPAPDSPPHRAPH